MVLPPGNIPHPGKLLDMGMLVMTGGRERTEAEYGNLLDRTNFRLVNVVPTEAPATCEACGKYFRLRHPEICHETRRRKRR